MTGIPFAKGHGTENDFVVLPDPDGSVWPEDRLTPDLVRRLCERRAGLGGDGVLRLVRSLHVPDAPAWLGDDLDRCTWFMDHRNADGSHAEMCGNGIRLFLHALVGEGLLDRSACADGVLVGTRGGPRRVGAAAGGGYWVDMGPARPFGEAMIQSGAPCARHCRKARTDDDEDHAGRPGRTFNPADRGRARALSRGY